jgi:hypothetical protein
MSKKRTKRWKIVMTVEESWDGGWMTDRSIAGTVKRALDLPPGIQITALGVQPVNPPKKKLPPI